jgi:histone deacetylase 1/2
LAAKDAAKRELRQLINLKTWKYLKRVEDASPSVHTRETPCSMFLKPKFDARGLFTLWKARLVDGGHMTDPERYDPHEKTSPTTSLEVVMLLLAIAVTKKLQVEGFDVPSAYLNANLEQGRFHKMRISKRIARILVEVDPQAAEFVQPDGTILVEIRKSLYGLPEAAKLWYEYLSGALKDGGYRQCPHDPCLFVRFGAGEQVSIVAIYVDDCLHVYHGDNMRRHLYNSLNNANLKDLKVEKLTHESSISFLGLNVERKGPREIFVNQKGYLDNLLDQYSEDIEAFPRNQSQTPCGEDIFRPNYSVEDQVPVNVTEFLSKLMRIRYLVRTRPDIELACSGLCTRSRSPVKGDMKALNKVLAYLHRTVDDGITITETDLQTVAFFDAAFAVHLDRKSHNGHLVLVGSGAEKVPIHWRSTKQKIVTTSSTEAELVTVFDGLDFLIWFRRVLGFLRIQQETGTIFQDNTSTITMALMGRGSSASNTRHIDTKYFFIQQFIEDGTFKIDHMPRENMLADFFASPRIGQAFRRMRDKIMHSS